MKWCSKKNVVNNVDMSSLRAPWQNGPYKNKDKKEHKHTQNTKTQQTLFFCVFKTNRQSQVKGQYDKIVDTHNTVGLTRNKKTLYGATIESRTLLNLVPRYNWVTICVTVNRDRWVLLPRFCYNNYLALWKNIGGIYFIY